MGYIWDAAAICLYFGVVLVVGYRAGRHHTGTVADFAVGNRQLPWWAVLASIIAAELTAATFLGTPGESFHSHNFLYAQLAVGTLIARIIVAWLFLRTFYDLKVVSIYEYLGVRFGATTRSVASIVFLLTRLLASGARLYVAAVIVVLAYEMITGAAASPDEKVFLYAGAIALVTALTTLYTAWGGIRAVVWTDVIQASVMAGAVVYTLASLWYSVGGWSGAHAQLRQPDDWKWYDFGGQPGQGIVANIKAVLGSEYTVWAALLGSVFTTMATHGTDQDMVQRMLTARDARRSRLALILSGVADLPIALAFLLIGVLLAAYYQLHPDPSLPASNPEVFAYFILHQLPAGARGLLVAGVLATAMGSLSTALNALATSFTEDFWLRYVKPNESAHDQVRSIRAATIFFAVLLGLVATLTAEVTISTPHARIIPLVLGIFGYTYGSLLGIFLVGLTTRQRGSTRGNLIAMAAGFFGVAILSGLPWDLVNVVRGTSYNLSYPLIWAIQHGWTVFRAGTIHPPDRLLQIEFPWRVMFGTLITFAIALLFRTPPQVERGPIRPAQAG